LYFLDILSLKVYGIAYSTHNIYNKLMFKPHAFTIKIYVSTFLKN